MWVHCGGDQGSYVPSETHLVGWDEPFNAFSELEQSPCGQGPCASLLPIAELRGGNWMGPRQVFVAQMSCSLLENWPVNQSLWGRQA